MKVDQPADDSLLSLTLNAAVRDAETVRDGQLMVPLLHGMSFWPVPTHVDDRGALVELYDPRWNWHPDPLVYSYATSIRPGVVKGWGLHRTHQDRYFLLQGEMELVCYDVRPDSPTCGQIAKIYLSQYHRRLINIPAYVWHADHNIGSTDAMLLNFPTIMFDHANPDKYRLPLDSDLIPHRFPTTKGW